MYSKNAVTHAIEHELRAKVAKGIIKDIVLRNAAENIGKQLSDIAAFANARSIDVVVIQTSDATAVQNIYEIIQAAHSSIPIIFLVPDESIFEKTLVSVRPYDKLGCIVMFGAEAGKVQAQFVHTFLRGRGRVGLLVDTLGSASQIYRTRGFEMGLKDTAVLITHQEAANSSSISALKIMERWIRNETNALNAVVANDDNMALGAALALREQGMQGRVLVIGGVMSEDAFTAVQAGDLQMTLAVNASAVLREILRMANYMMREELFDKTVEVTPLAVTVKNVHMFVR